MGEDVPIRFFVFLCLPKVLHKREFLVPFFCEFLLSMMIPSVILHMSLLSLSKKYCDSLGSRGDFCAFGL